METAARRGTQWYRAHLREKIENMVDWVFVAPMVAIVVTVVTLGGVILLRPLTKRLGELIEVMAQNRREPRLEEELARTRELLQSVSERLSLVEERQDFTDQLLQRGGTAGEGRRLNPGPETEGT